MVLYIVDDKQNRSRIDLKNLLLDNDSNSDYVLCMGYGYNTSAAIKQPLDTECKGSSDCLTSLTLSGKPLSFSF